MDAAVAGAADEADGLGEGPDCRDEGLLFCRPGERGQCLRKKKKGLYRWGKEGRKGRTCGVIVRIVGRPQTPEVRILPAQPSTVMARENWRMRRASLARYMRVEETGAAGDGGLGSGMLGVGGVDWKERREYAVR